MTREYVETYRGGRIERETLGVSKGPSGKLTPIERFHWRYGLKKIRWESLDGLRSVVDIQMGPMPDRPEVVRRGTPPAVKKTVVKKKRPLKKHK